jgi:hypothetical protein
MQPKILGRITAAEIISSGVSLRVRRRLRKLYGPWRWRKLKGVAKVQLPDGFVVLGEVHWYEAHGIGRKEPRSSVCWRHRMSNDTFVLCIDNRGYAASLEQRKVYRAMSDPAAEKHALVRVVDESSEDYLFPAKLFVPIAVPQAAAKAFRASRGTRPAPLRRRLSPGAAPRRGPRPVSRPAATAARDRRSRKPRPTVR